MPYNNLREAFRDRLVQADKEIGEGMEKPIERYGWGGTGGRLEGEVFQAQARIQTAITILESLGRGLT